MLNLEGSTAELEMLVLTFRCNQSVPLVTDANKLDYAPWRIADPLSVL